MYVCMYIHMYMYIYKYADGCVSCALALFFCLCSDYVLICVSACMGLRGRGRGMGEVCC